MPDRIDKVFSLERLRRSWERTGSVPEGAGPAQGEEALSPEVASPPTGAPEAAEIFKRLKELVGERFPAREAGGLEVLLAELGELIEERFAGGGGVEGALPDPAASAPRIEEILNQLEDLFEALEIAVGNRREAESVKKP
jgi:hypothetical protein